MGDGKVVGKDEWAQGNQSLILSILSQAKMTFWAGAGAEKDYAIRLWNPGAEKIYGHSRAQALGQSYIDLFVNPRERARAIEDHERIIATGEVYEWDWAADDLTKGNKVRTMLTHCFRVRDPRDGEWLLAEIGIDISDFARATQQLRMLREDDFARREMGLAYAVGEIGRAVSQVAVDGSTYLVAEKVFAAARQAVTGVGKCTMWLVEGSKIDRFDEANSEMRRDAFKEKEALDRVVDSGEAIFFDTHDRHPDGLDLSIGGRRGRKRSFAVLPLRTFRSTHLGVLGVSLTTGKELVQKDRARLESVAAFAGPLLSVAQELQRTRDERARRLEVQTKQKVFDSVLHSIGNNVFELRGLADSMGTDARQDVPADIRELLVVLRDKAENLNTSLAALRRDLESEDSPEDIPILEAATDLLNRLRISHTNVQFTTEISPEHVVHIVRVWLNHILENLVTNAVQILEHWIGGGEVRISTREWDTKTEIHIEDNGPGVDEAIAANLFQRGVTRRPGGSGEGLAIATELAARSRGHIMLVPRPSSLGGAHFCITLPTSEESSAVGRTTTSTE